MAISDGLICQVYPVAGETAIKNIVDGTLFTGAGTPTLVDEGAEKAWSVVAGTLVQSVIPSKTPSSNVAGSGVTIAIRFKPTANGSGADFLSIIGVKPDAASVDTGTRVSRSGNGSFRGRSDNQLNASLTGFNLNTVYTLVYKIELSPVAASDFGKLWRNTVGRVGTAADVSTVGSEYSINRTLNRAFVNCQNGVTYTLLDFAYWDRELSDSECASVADNYRGVMPTPSSGTPITFSGTIPAQTFTNGDAVSVNLAAYFSGTQTPFTFANTGTSLSGTGLSISSAGVLTGTATTGSVTGVIITGTDTDTDTASSNAFNVTVNASAVPVSFTGTVPTLSGAENEAITPVDLSAYFSGSLTPFTYSLQAGSLPTGLSLNSSTGVISGTPTVDFSGSAIVRATDTGANTADTNSFLISIAAEAVPSFTLTDLCNNAGAPIASTSGITVDVYNQSTGALVVRKTGMTSTAGSDVVVSDAALSIGTEYNVFITIGTAIGAVKATAV